MRDGLRRTFTECRAMDNSRADNGSRTAGESPAGFFASVFLPQSLLHPVPTVALYSTISGR